MKKPLTIAIAVSISAHAAFFIGVTLWSLRYVGQLGGGGGIVEVGIVGDGSGPVRPERVEGRMTSASTSSARTVQNSDPSPYMGEGGPATKSFAGDGEGSGGSGGGVGSDSGPGDPRLVAIWKKINRAKYYPEMARRDGVEGAPKVAFSITEDGKVGGVKIVQSSGNEILDKAAVEAIQNSSPLPFYPQPITIAVRYSLKDR